MSFFWSSWITIFSLGCWLFIAGVLFLSLKFKPPLEDDGTTGHEYDGIKEYDKPLPKWWLTVFFATMVWSIGYFVFFPAIQPASWQGLSTVEVDGEQIPWTSANELASDLQSNNQRFLSNFETVLNDADAAGATAVLTKLNSLQAELKKEGAQTTELETQIKEQITALAPYVDKLANNREALKMGNSLFLQNCALCHGSTAQGSVGYPNLTDNDWLYGGDAANVLTSIYNGRVGSMAAWQKDIGEAGVRAASEYVMSISGNLHEDVLDTTLVKQGEAIFNQNCTLCHGQDAKGLTEFGAPNLTDDTWLYGSTRADIQTTIRHGRAGVMPAWATRLGAERVMLLAAHVRSLQDAPAQ